ncbi:MAG: septation protein SepH [Mycobacteriaceae bacterium]
MRALRVIGLDADGLSVVCEDSERNEKFLVRADDKLRAAARGDLTRLGQIEIELESQLRPRDIQARIRSGATVEQVAAIAGVPESRVERFAYPVLLERSRAAEVAQGGHPLRHDGPTVLTLTEIVADALALRGQDLTDATWDAWRGEDSRWVVQLCWKTGRSDNKAHWRFQPGAHGGTVTALDDPAADLIDPEPTRPLRTITTVIKLPEPEPEPEVELAPEPQVEPAAEVEAPPVPATARTAAKAPKGRRGRAAVPSWEDVLLGVRSQRG